MRQFWSDKAAIVRTLASMEAETGNLHRWCCARLLPSLMSPIPLSPISNSLSSRTDFGGHGRALSHPQCGACSHRTRPCARRTRDWWMLCRWELLVLWCPVCKGEQVCQAKLLLVTLSMLVGVVESRIHPWESSVSSRYCVNVISYWRDFFSCSSIGCVHCVHIYIELWALAPFPRMFSSISFETILLLSHCPYEMIADFETVCCVGFLLFFSCTSFIYFQYE